MKKIIPIFLSVLLSAVSCQTLADITFKVNGVKFKMVRVQGGKFDMGATPEQNVPANSDELPVHQVTMTTYYIGETEVTQELWKAVTGKNPSHNNMDMQNPVENVSWNQIVNEFLPALNKMTGVEFTLPTEAQWQFAARGGRKTMNFRFSGSDNLDDTGWYLGNSDKSTQEVRRKYPNELGVYDMSGNVREWCFDRYGKYTKVSQKDPAGPPEGDSHVVCGGDITVSADNCRVSSRMGMAPSSLHEGLGFRIVLAPSTGRSVKPFTEVPAPVEPSKEEVVVPHVDTVYVAVESSADTAASNTAAADTTLAETVVEEPQEAAPVLLDKMVLHANGASFTMCLVKGGSFSMGATPDQGAEADSDEKPVHTVYLSDYYIGECEVTQALWTAVMHSNPSVHRGNEQFPVENISWNEIMYKFLPALNAATGKNFSLPTEAQWEFAARGGNNGSGSKFSGGNTLGNFAWYSQNSGRKSHEVGQKAPNELGLYDMCGNLYEWCYDWHGAYSSLSETDPKGPANGSERILRGGFYGGAAKYCRIANRGTYPPESKRENYGFRLVLNL